MSDSVLPETQISRLEAKVQEHRSEAVDAKRWAMQERTGRHAALAEVDRLRLTDAEREDLRLWMSECLDQSATATNGGNTEVAERWEARAKRAVALLERHAKGGEA